MKKRGQISIFIIVGVVLLLAVGSFLILRARTADIRLEGRAPKIAEVPVEFQPVNKYVQDCMKTVAEEGLIILGAQGGYIDTSSFRVNPVEPTEGDAMPFARFSDYKIPYWYHMKSNNKCKTDCTFATNMPYLHWDTILPSIEDQLDKYMLENLPICLNSFQPFEGQGYEIIEPDTIYAETAVQKSRVAFFVRYPIQATKESTHEMEDFLVMVPVKLRSMYETARTITSHEVHELFLETYVLNYISTFGGINGKIPPIEELELKYGLGASWIKSDVKKSIKDYILAPYIPILNVVGARNYKNYSKLPDPIQSVLYTKILNLNLGLEEEFTRDLQGFNVDFAFLPQWPIYMDLNCNGEFCTSTPLSSEILEIIGMLIGMQRYKFLYDLSYPIMVSIEDPTALNNKGYTFRFMMEGNIRNSRAINGSFEERIIPAVGSMLCELEQFDTGNIIVGVKDAVTKRHVNNASITYTCDVETCAVGISEDGQLESKFPRCIGGMLGVTAEGYASNFQFVNFEEGEDKGIEVEMEPLRTKKLKLKKKPVTKVISGDSSFWQPHFDYDSARRTDFEHEKALIRLRKVKETLSEPDFQITQFYKEGEENTIDIFPGKYEADIFLFSNQSFTIPPDRRCPEVGIIGEIFTTEEETCYYIPEEPMSINESIAGGFNGEIEITAEDLNQFDTIILYIAAPDFESVQTLKIEDLGEMGKIDEYSLNYPNEFQPRYENS